MSRFAHDLAEEELTLEEFDVLVHLAWARDGVLPLRALVASMVSGYQLSRSGLTRLLDRMERDGLVERSLSRADRRQFDVAITGAAARSSTACGLATGRASSATSLRRSRATT